MYVTSEVKDHAKLLGKDKMIDWTPRPPKNTQPHLTLSRPHLNREVSHSGLGHWCSGLRHGGISFSGIHRVDAGEHKSVTGVR